MRTWAIINYARQVVPRECSSVSVLFRLAEHACVHIHTQNTYSKTLVIGTVVHLFYGGVTFLTEETLAMVALGF